MITLLISKKYFQKCLTTFEIFEDWALRGFPAVWCVRAGVRVLAWARRARVRTHAHTPSYTQCAWVYLCAWMYVYVHLCAWVCVCVCGRVCVCVCVCLLCPCACGMCECRMHTQIHAYIHMIVYCAMGVGGLPNMHTQGQRYGGVHIRYIKGAHVTNTM